jgi:hypothetical protein
MSIGASSAGSWTSSPSKGVPVWLVTWYAEVWFAFDPPGVVQRLENSANR